MRISDWSSDVCSSDLIRVCHGSSLVVHQSEATFAGKHLGEGARLVYGEDKDRDTVFAGKRYGGMVHDAEIVGQHPHVAQGLVAGGAGVLGRVGVVDRKSTRLNSSH